MKLHAKVRNFIEKRLQHRCFPVNIVKFIRTALFIEHLRWLLLRLIKQLFEMNSTTGGFLEIL